MHRFTSIGSRDARSFLLAAGLSACSTAAPAPTPEGTSTGTSNVILCNDDESIEGRELYVLSAINATLDYFPELAAAADLSAVSNCEEARAFVAAYRAYSEAHPGFDRDQPRGKVPDFPAPVAGPPPRLEQVKLGNGSPGYFGVGFPTEPVVRIVQIKTFQGQTIASGGSCTGTFIAKNWLATAAHCLQVVTPPPPGGAAGAKELSGYAQWRVEWPGGDGSIVKHVDAQAADVLQIADPDFKGTNLANNDFGLLFFPKKTYDPLLPDEPSLGSAMGIFVTPPSTSEPTFAVGASTGAMRFGQLPSFALGGAVATSTATATSPLVCSGDSGGPIMQRPLVDDIPMPLFFGTAVGMPAPPPGTPSETCPPPGTTELWWRVDGRGKGNGEIDFISEQVEKWIGHCHDVPIPGGTALQCWGESCRGDADCGASEYCSAPASDYTGQCPICADSTQGCDCIEGQCLPQPKFTN